MSIKALAWAWEQPVGGTEKLVLLGLADNASDQGICWPGIKHLLKKCGISENSVHRAIRSLIAGGFVTVRDRWREDGGRSSNHYFLGFYDGSPSPLCPDADKHAESFLTGASTKSGTGASTKNGTGLVPKMAPHEPSLEPSLVEPGTSLEDFSAIAPKSSKGGRAKRTSPSPADVDTEYLQQMETEHPQLDVYRQHMKWHDHNEAIGWRTRSGPIRDFRASFRKWLSNAEDYGELKGGNRTGISPPPPPVDWEKEVMRPYTSSANLGRKE